MTELQIVLLICFFHIILCILIYLGIRTRLLKFSEQLMPIIVLIPIVGMITALIADYNSRFHKAGTKEIMLEELHLGIEDLRLQNIESQVEGEIVIPLEEAMLVNDAETRRKLMLDILHQNPDQYAALLQQACTDNDIEVSHYASTAVMEMQREYEMSLQKAEKDYRENPDDAEKLHRCLISIERYINSNLIDENVIMIYRKRYADMLLKQLKMASEDMESALKAIENCLQLRSFTEAKSISDLLIQKWPNREDSWTSRLKLCYQMNDYSGIQYVLDEVKRRNVYLTPHGKSVMQFWSIKNQKEDEELVEVS